MIIAMNGGAWGGEEVGGRGGEEDGSGRGGEEGGKVRLVDDPSGSARAETSKTETAG